MKPILPTRNMEQKKDLYREGPLGSCLFHAYEMYMSVYLKGLKNKQKKAFINFRKYLLGACFGSASLLGTGVRLEEGLTNGNKIVAAAESFQAGEVRKSKLV